MRQFLLVICTTLMVGFIQAQTYNTAAGTVTWINNTTNIGEVTLITGTSSHGDGYDGALRYSITNGSLTTTNEYNFSSTYGAVIQMVSVTNTTGSSATYNIQFTGNLGSDGSTVWHYSDGNGPNYYTVSSDRTSPTINGSDPVISFLFGNQRLDDFSATKSLSISNGSDNYNFTVGSITIPNNTTQRYIIIGGVGNIDDNTSNQPDQAYAAVQLLTDEDNWPADFTSWMTPQEKAEVVNWSLFAPVFTEEQPPSCFGSNDAILSVQIYGGEPPYTFTWSTGTTTQSGQPIAGYTLLGHNDEHSYYVRNAKPATYNDASTEARSLFGYLVSIGSAAEQAWLVANGMNGNYIGLTDQDVEGTFVWDSGEPLTYTNWSSGEPNNFGGNEHYVETSSSGLWNDNDWNYPKMPIIELPGMSRIENLSAGSYTVTVTDNAGITISATYTIANPDSLIVLPGTVTPTTCNTSTDGTASVNITGGASPFNYLWDANANNQTSPIASNLGVGSYSVTVTDDKGCTDFTTVQVTSSDLTPPTATILNSYNAYLDNTGNYTVLESDIISNVADNCDPSPVVAISNTNYDCNDIGASSDWTYNSALIDSSYRYADYYRYNNEVYLGAYNASTSTLDINRWDGTQWQLVSKSSTGVLQPYAQVAFTVDDAGDFYFAYPDQSNRRLHIVQYDGTTWNDLVSGTVNSTYSVSQIIYAVRSELDPVTGDVWWVYTSSSSSGGTYRVNALKWDGTALTHMGYPSLTGMPYPGDWTNSADIDFLSNGTPVVIYGHRNYQNHPAMRPTVVTYNGSNWVDAGPINSSISRSYDPHIEITPNDRVYVTFRAIEDNYGGVFTTTDFITWDTVYYQSPDPYQYSIQLHDGPDNQVFYRYSTTANSTASGRTFIIDGLTYTDISAGGTRSLHSPVVTYASAGQYLMWGAFPYNSGDPQYFFTRTALGVAYSITDASSNVNSGVVQVNVYDTISPSVLVKDTTLQLTAAGTVSLTAPQLDIGSSDNCAIASSTIDRTSFTCADIGIHTVTTTVTDVNGNVSTAASQVTIEDNVAPTVVTQNITVALDASGQASITAADVDNGSSDACGIASRTIDVSTFTCADLTSGPGTFDGVTTLNFDGTDDFVEPSTMIPYSADHTITAWVRSTTINRNLFGWGGAGTNNYCSVSFLGGSPRYYAGNGTPPVQSVTATASILDGNWHHLAISRDAAGNVAIYIDGTLNVNGSVSKVVSLPTRSIIGASFANGIVQGNFQGDIDQFTVWSKVLSASEIQALTCTTPGSDPNLVANYNFEDGTGSTTLSDLTGNGYDGALTNMDGSNDWVSFGSPVTTPYCNPGTSVTLTVTDNNGNTATAVASVNVIDDLSPTATIISPFDVYLDNNGQYTVQEVDFISNVADNCDPSPAVVIANTSFDCGDIGMTTLGVNYSISDIYGNVNSGVAMVNVLDGAGPAITLPDTTVYVDNHVSQTILPRNWGTYIDACTTVVDTQFNQYTFGVADAPLTVVTATATDFFSNVNTGNGNVNVVVCNDDTVSVCATGCDFTTIQEALNCPTATYIHLDVNGVWTETGIEVPFPKSVHIYGNDSTNTIWEPTSYQAGVVDDSVVFYMPDAADVFELSHLTFRDWTGDVAFHTPWVDTFRLKEVNVINLDGTWGETVPPDNFYYQEGGSLARIGDRNLMGNTDPSNLSDENIHLQIDGSQFSGNTAVVGGVIIIHDYSLTADINNSLFENNQVAGYGGAIAFNTQDGFVALYNTDLASNQALEKGGAVYFEEDAYLTIDGGNWTSNHADDDGGVFSIDDDLYAYDTRPLIQNVYATGNTASNDGGVFYLYEYEDGVGQDSTFVNVVFTNNSALSGDGGVWYISDDCNETLGIFNSTFDGNNADNSGGVFFIGDYLYDDAIWMHSTFSNNTAGNDGGVLYVYDEIDAGDFYIDHCIFDNNSADDDGGVICVNEDLFGDITILNTTITNNEAYYGGFMFIDTDMEDDFVMDSCIVSNNEAQYGGVFYVDDDIEEDFIIRHSSIAGNHASESGGFLYLDSDYFDGAFELVESTFENNTAAEFGGVFYLSSDVETSMLIRNTTFNANSVAGEDGGVFCIGGDIYGIEMDSATITNNSADGAGGFFNLDGAIFGDLAVRNSTFSDNTAHTHDGGVFAVYSSIDDDLIVQHNTVRDNASGRDGGFMNLQTVNDQVIVENNLFRDNSADNLGGVLAFFDPLYGNIRMDSITAINNSAQASGGFFYINSPIEGDSLVITHSSFEHNQAVNDDGGAFRFSRVDAASRLEQVTFTSNHAGRDGGVIYVADTSHRWQMHYNLFTDNISEQNGAIGYWGDYVNYVGIAESRIDSNAGESALHLINPDFLDVYNSTFVGHNSQIPSGITFASTDAPVVFGALTAASVATFTNTLFYNNAGDQASAIAAPHGTVRLHYTTLANGTSSVAAVNSTNATVEAVASLFANNNSTDVVVSGTPSTSKLAYSLLKAYSIPMGVTLDTEGLIVDPAADFGLSPLTWDLTKNMSYTIPINDRRVMAIMPKSYFGLAEDFDQIDVERGNVYQTAGAATAYGANIEVTLIEDTCQTAFAITETRSSFRPVEYKVNDNGYWSTDTTYVIARTDSMTIYTRFQAPDASYVLDTTIFLDVDSMIVDTTPPQIITKVDVIYLDSTGHGSTSAQALDAGSNDLCELDTIWLERYDFDCTDIGLTPVTFYAQDVYGFVDSATAYVVVLDYINPIVITQNQTVYLDANGEASITPMDIDNGSWDNCGIWNVPSTAYQLDKSDFTCADIGDNTVTLTVQDLSSNTSSGTATVTVVDAIAPTMIAQSLTVHLDGNGQGAITAAMADNGSFDNCAIDQMWLSRTDFTCVDAGQNFTLTLYGEDASGNVGSTIFNVVVDDVTAPTVVTQPAVVSLDANGNGTITPQDVDGGTFDNCVIDRMEVSPNAFDCADVGQVTVTLKAWDEHNHMSSATALVTIQDVMPPVVVTQDVTVQLDAQGQANISEAMINNGSYDNCGIASMSLDMTAFDCQSIGTHTVTLTVEDVNGNQAQGAAMVTVEDNQLPTVLTQDVTVQLDAQGQASITAAMIDNGSSDNCGVASLALDITDFDCTDIGANTVVLTVHDVNGNSAQGSATVTVEDNISPTVVTQNITVQLDANGQANITVAMIDNGSSDNCGIASRTLDRTTFDCTDIGTQTVTLTVTDVNGNMDQATATVVVQDILPPVVLTQDLTIQLDAQGQATITAAMIDNGSYDNCGVSSMSLDMTAFDCQSVGTHTVTLTVEDVNGNQSQGTATVTVEDTQAPSVSASGLTIYLDANGDASITMQDVQATSSDNCGVVGESLSQMVFDCSDVGANLITYEAWDASGNIGQVDIIITVIDNIDPTPVVQNVTVPLNVNGVATITPNMIDNGSYDNCGIAQLQVYPTTFVCSQIGTYTVTFTVTDASGNVSTATALVTVVDQMAPTIICPPNKVVNSPANQCGAVVTYALPTTTDNCYSNVRQIAGIPSGSTFPVGVTTNVYEAYDGSGNTASCSFTVTVKDVTPPQITCRPDLVVDVLPGTCAATVTFGKAQATDNCTGVTTDQVSGPTSGSVLNIGTYTVVQRATDGSGNTSTCSFKIIVRDRTKPVITCPIDVLAIADPGACETMVTWNMPTATDNCGQPITVTQTSGPVAGSMIAVGTYSATY